MRAQPPIGLILARRAPGSLGLFAKRPRARVQAANDAVSKYCKASTPHLDERRAGPAAESGSVSSVSLPRQGSTR